MANSGSVTTEQKDALADALAETTNGGEGVAISPLHTLAPSQKSTIDSSVLLITWPPSTYNGEAEEHKNEEEEII